MEIAVVDDNSADGEALRTMISEYAEEHALRPCEISMFSSGRALMVEESRFDLVLLDIEMPEMNGMQTARKLRDSGFVGDIVFVTVLGEPVFDAFEVGAADYLMKPVERSRLWRTLDRVSARYGRRNSVFVQRRSDSEIVSLDEVEYVEVRGRKLFLHRLDGTVVSFYERMREFEARAGSQYYRCHRSYLVNLDMVVSAAQGQIGMRSGTKVPLSRLREHDFREALLRRIRMRA